MCSYLSTDILRLLRRFPRWLMVLLGLGGLAVITAIIAQLGVFGRFNSVVFVDAVKKMIKPLPLIIGIIEILFIFGDDLKARTLQASIGVGLPRAGLVMSKFIEVALFTLMDVIIYALFTFAMGWLFQANLVTSQVRELSICFFIEWIKALGYTTLTMILIFFTRGIGLGIVLYIALFARIIDKAAGVLLTIGPMEQLHLDRYTMSTFIDTLQTYLIGGVSGLKPLLFVLAYIAVGCLAAVLLFQKRELEF